jgi:endonuclease G
MTKYAMTKIQNILLLGLMIILQPKWSIGQHAAQVSLHKLGHAHQDSLSNIPHLEIPKIHKGEEIIQHTGYTLCYNETHEQAAWVAYELTKVEMFKVCKRTNRFTADPTVTTGSAVDEDYKGSGFDRGHLAPAADMAWSTTTMAESFYFSNMSPQRPQFNRGIWKKLEEQVREWAKENNAIYIVTGPVLKSGLNHIGIDEVSVPNYYYKVILDYSQPDIKAIGFVLPNEGSTESIQHFAVSIDSVEQLTGIDFFPLLPDAIENKLEQELCLSCWTWASHTNYRKTDHSIKTKD